MNTAPKLRDLATQFGDYSADERGRESWEFDEYGLAQFAAALAPPSGRWADELDQERAEDIRAAIGRDEYARKALDSLLGDLAHQRDDNRRLYRITTPQSAPVDGITAERLERHKIKASECPDASDVVLLSSLKRMLTTPPPASQEGGDILGVDAERHEDMSPTGRLRLHAQDDGDMCVMVIEDDGTSATVEFCNSGGKSPRTLQALRDLSRAMQADASPPSSAAESDGVKVCTYANCTCDALHTTTSGEPIDAAEQASSAAEGCNDPDGTIAVELRAATETQRLAAVSGSNADAAEQAKPDASGYAAMDFLVSNKVEQAQAGELIDAIVDDVMCGLLSKPITRDELQAALLRRLAGGVTVDDALVLRAAIKYASGEWDYLPIEVQKSRYDRMRAALVAALVAK